MRVHHCSSVPQTEAHRTLQQVEAYLNLNLDIMTTLIDSTRSELTSLESQLCTPARSLGTSESGVSIEEIGLQSPPAQVKRRKGLRSARNRYAKKLRQSQAEAEVLTRALDEVKSKLALLDFNTEQSALSGSAAAFCIPTAPMQSNLSSPAETVSTSSSSICSSLNTGYSLPFPLYPAPAPRFHGIPYPLVTSYNDQYQTHTQLHPATAMFLHQQAPYWTPTTPAELWSAVTAPPAYTCYPWAPFQQDSPADALLSPPDSVTQYSTFKPHDAVLPVTPELGTQITRSPALSEHPSTQSQSQIQSRSQRQSQTHDTTNPHKPARRYSTPT